jgi:hypothetical protein
MVNLTGQEAGNGGYSKGTPKAHRALLCSESQGTPKARCVLLYSDAIMWTELAEHIVKYKSGGQPI